MWEEVGEVVFSSAGKGAEEDLTKIAVGGVGEAVGVSGRLGEELVVELLLLGGQGMHPGWS